MKKNRSILNTRWMRDGLRLVMIALPAVVLIACGGDKPGDDPKNSDGPVGLRGAVKETDSSAAHDTTAHADTMKVKNNQTKLSGLAEAQFPEIKYTRVALTRSLLDSVRRRFGKTKESSDGFRAITTLNRKEFGYFHVGDTIVIPDTVIGDLRAYSVFPARYPAADSIRKLILISNKYQCYACYEHGKLVRFAACNSGTERKATFPGRYALNWKERLRISSLNENWKLPFTFNFHLYAGNAFHQFTMPGRPVSHSCVRQFMPDAEWLFNWGEGGLRDSSGRMIPLSGTPVIIIDVFDFSRPRGGPWLELTSNRENVLNLPENPMGVEEAWIPISQVPTDARGGIPNRARYLAAEDTLRARGVIRPGVSLSASINYNALRKAKEKRAAAAKGKPKAKEAAPETPKVDAG